jgi:predicted HTH domain antitoxin
MTTIAIEVPDDVFSALRRSPDEFARDLLRAAAIQWYSQGLISQGKAAEIAGLSRTDFLHSLAHAKVDAFQISEEELKEEVQRDLEARRKSLANHLPDTSGTYGSGMTGVAATLCEDLPPDEKAAIEQEMPGAQCGRPVVFFDEAVGTDAIETVRGEKGIHDGEYDS